MYINKNKHDITMNSWTKPYLKFVLKPITKNGYSYGFISEADILYIFVKEGSIKDTIEVSDDLFVEYDENNRIAG